MRIASIGRALPPNYCAQEDLIAGFRELWSARIPNIRRFEEIHRNAEVGGRHLVLPMAEYLALDSFTRSNDLFIRHGLELGADAIRDGLERAGLGADALRHIFFVSVTGIATPSLDARLVNRLGLRSDIKRTPIFGLGCVAGAAGLARVHDYLKAYPNEAALLLSVELCSLSFHLDDLSLPNIVACALFGDGAAAAICTGTELESSGPEVVATRSVFYPNTEDTMGWEVTSEGFKIVLSGAVPKVARGLRKDVDAFLAEHGLTLDAIESFVCHPGGPRVLEALEESLERPREAFELSWRSLRAIGNLSSASVLLILRDTLAERRPPRGSYGLLLAMGPGFCSELVLLRW
jgi:alkylresorcinol/alkylpyrone synthase